MTLPFWKKLFHLPDNISQINKYKREFIYEKKNLICNYSKIQKSYKRRGERFKSLFSAEIRFIDRCPVLFHPCLQPTHWINNSTETTKPIITSVVKLEAKVNEQTTQFTTNFLQNLLMMEQEHLLTRKSNLNKTLYFFTWKTSQVATYSFCTDESRSLNIVSSKISQEKCFLIKSYISETGFLSVYL